MQQQQTTYPTKWQLGKSRGTANERDNDYRAVISPPGQKQINKIFSFSKYGTKANAKKEADKWCQELSDKLGLTRNQIRYINKDIIEVQLTQDKIMKTNAKFIDKVELYPLNIKTKKSKTDSTKDRHYVMCQNIKEVFPFTDLICKYKIVEYINGDSLDLREENLKEFGSVLNKKIKVGTEVIELTNDDVNIQYECFSKDINDLPKNIWILGKPAGTIFKRSNNDNIYNVRVNDEEDNPHTKTFNVSKYNSDKEAYNAAEKWRIETSYKLGMTENMIKIIDENIIEVKLTKNEIMKTDKIFIPLLQKINVCVGTSGNGIKYVVATFDKQTRQFHGLITGFDMVDHIDGNTLNNCLKNLRYCDFSMNNSNRHITNNKHGYMGIKLEETPFGQSYVARISINGKSYTKYFSVSKYGEDEAKELAIEFRKKIENVTKYISNITDEDDEQLLRIELIKLKNTMKYIQQKTVYDAEVYLSTIDINDNEHNNMHSYYLDEQMKYYKWCREEHGRLSSILIKKITKN